MQLRTFGGLSIDAQPGNGPAPSPGPRRLALLALVAAAGPRGITREKIVGILWAESGERQARHRLSQTLYLLRRETGTGWVAGNTQLRLEPPDSSDITQFRQALDAGQLERAAALYAGPFLDGFYLAGTPEFEAWAEELRARLHYAALKALEQLARRAVDAGCHAEAADWWRRLAELDPFNAGYAAAQVRALMAAGEPAIALRFAREYEARVRRELDAVPDPVLVELIARLLSTPTAVDPPRVEPRPGIAPAAPAPTPEGPFGDDTPAPAPGAAATVPLLRRSRRLRVPAVLVAALVTAAVVLRIGATPSAGTMPPILAIGSIQPRNAAAPGTVLRDMLATNLARVTGLQVVANSRLVELLARTDSVTPTETADAARRAGAGEIVEGELEATEGGLILTMRRVALKTGVVLHGHTVRAADLYALTDSATAAIANDFRLDPPPNAVAAVRTGSAVAYALYEQGLRAYYHSDQQAAIRLMSAALERDSTFAMAAAYAWRSSLDANRYEDAGKLVPVVKRLAARAVDRERLWIEGMLAHAGAPLSEFLGIAREMTRQYPGDPDGQILLGRALFAAGDWAGSVAAYDRAVAIDSAAGATTGSFCRVCLAIYDMSNAYAWWDSLPAAERTTRRLTAFRPEDEAGWGGLTEVLLRQGHRVEGEATIAKAAGLSSRRIDFGTLLDRDLIRSGRLDELEARLVSELRIAAPDARGEMPWLLAFTLRNQGRLREARDLAARGVVPGSPVRLDGHHDPISLASVELENGQARESARRFLDMVAADRARREEAGFEARNTAWHMTLAGTALAAAGDTAAVRALADSVERIGVQSSFGRDYRLHHFLRGLLLQQQNRHAEAVEAFRRSIFSLTDGYTRINLEMASSLMALQRYPEAIAVLQPALRGGVDGGNTYVTHTEIHEALARAFEAAGRPDSAAAHFASVARAWRNADPQFAERYRYAAARAAPSH